MLDSTKRTQEKRGVGVGKQRRKIRMHSMN